MTARADRAPESPQPPTSPRAWPFPFAPWRSLRGRATLAFTAAVLVLTAIASVVVWVAVSQYLMSQRERSTLAQVVANAEQVQSSLAAQGLSRPELLAQLPREAGSTSLLVEGEEWYTTSLDIGRDDLPVELRDAVLAGEPSRQRLVVDGRPVLAIGVPLAGLGQGYFEVFPITELDQTLRVLSAVLFFGVLLMTPAAALLGWWVTAPAMRPLTAISEGAARLAQGDLTARMDPRGHPELIPIAASFNAAAADLERRVMADARFAADVSHELRNPLMTMLGSVSLLEQNRDRLPDEAAEAVKLLAAEVNRFARLVQDLLEISRMDAAGTNAELSSVVLADLVRWALPERMRDALVVEPEAASVTVLGDKRRLEQVIANLVANAEQHGGGVTSVSVRCDPTGAEVVVDDAGPGVPVEQRSRIFERFARGAAGGRGAGDGTGLGLSLVDRHIQTMHGAVAVGDNECGGARFVVRLPLEER